MYTTFFNFVAFVCNYPFKVPFAYPNRKTCHTDPLKLLSSMNGTIPKNLFHDFVLTCEDNVTYGNSSCFQGSFVKNFENKQCGKSYSMNYVYPLNLHLYVCSLDLVPQITLSVLMALVKAWRFSLSGTADSNFLSGIANLKGNAFYFVFFERFDFLYIWLY